MHAENKTHTRIAVFINIANKITATVGGVILMSVVAARLSEAMLGFYYTFYSLVFIRFFSEMGLNVAVVQTISHLKTDPHAKLEVKRASNFFSRWFKIAGIALFFVLVPLIYIYRDRYKEIPGYEFNIIYPWLLLSLATSISVYQVGLTSILEGHRMIREVSKIRFATSFVNIFGAVILILLDFKLWSMALAMLLSVLMGSVYLWRIRHLLYTGREYLGLGLKFWKEKILPFQWRLAVSWVSGFFIFYFYTPYVMHLYGPEQAGKIGLTLQILLFISTLTVISVATRAPQFGSLASLKKISELNKQFILVSIKSTFSLLGILTAGLILVCFNAFDMDRYLMGRLVPKDELLFYGLAAIGIQVFMLLNHYMRLFKDESLWVISALHAITTVFFCVLVLPSVGLSELGIMLCSAFTLYWVGIAPILVHSKIKKYRTG